MLLFFLNQSTIGTHSNVFDFISNRFRFFFFGISVFNFFLKQNLFTARKLDSIQSSNAFMKDRHVYHVPLVFHQLCIYHCEFFFCVIFVVPQVLLDSVGVFVGTLDARE